MLVFDYLKSGIVKQVSMTLRIDAFVDHADYNFRSSLLLFKEHPRYQEIKGIYDEWVKSEMEK